MILDIHISYGAVFGFFFLLGLIPILVLLSWHHILTYQSKKNKRSKTALKVISILLFFDSGFFTIQQAFYNEPTGLLALGIGVVIYSIMLMFVAFRREKPDVD